MRKMKKAGFVYRGMKGRKREVRLSVFILAALFAFMTAVFCYQSSGQTAMDQTRKNLYGEWQTAKYGLTLQQEDTFLSSIPVEKSAQAMAYQKVLNAQGLPVGAIGTVDDSFMDMGHLKVMSGKLPEEKNEIALTVSLLDSMGLSYEVGQRVSLPLAEHAEDEPIEAAFTLSGILPAYDAFWITGENQPVNAIVVGAEALPQVSDPEIQIFATLKKGSKAIVPIVDGKEDPTFIVNTAVYPETSTLQIRDWHMLLVCFLLVLSVSGMLFMLLLQKRSDSIVTMQMLGASKKKVFQICLTEALILLGISLPLGTLTGFILCALGLAAQGQLENITLPAATLIFALVGGSISVVLGAVMPALLAAGKRRLHLSPRVCRRETKIRLAPRLRAGTVLLSGGGLLLIVVCLFLANFQIAPYRLNRDNAAININSHTGGTLSEGLVQDLQRIPDVAEVSKLTALSTQCSLQADAFWQIDLWDLYNKQSSMMLFMENENTVQGGLFMVSDETFAEMAALCGIEVPEEDNAVLLYAPGIARKDGTAVWSQEDAPHIEGEKATLALGKFSGDPDAVKQTVQIAGSFGKFPKGNLLTNNIGVFAYSVFCRKSVAENFWSVAFPPETPFGYTNINVRLTPNADYASRKTVASLVTHRGGMMAADSYDQVQQAYLNGSAGAFLWVVAALLLAGLLIFLQMTLAQTEMETQKKRIGILQALGTSHKMLNRCYLSRSMKLCLAGTLVSTFTVFGMMWIVKHTELFVQLTFIFTMGGRDAFTYPWTLHILLCTGYIILTMLLYQKPLCSMLRNTPVQNMREETR